MELHSAQRPLPADSGKRIRWNASRLSVNVETEVDRLDSVQTKRLRKSKSSATLHRWSGSQWARHWRRWASRTIDVLRSAKIIPSNDLRNSAEDYGSTYCSRDVVQEDLDALPNLLQESNKCPPRGKNWAKSDCPAPPKPPRSSTRQASPSSVGGSTTDSRPASSTGGQIQSGSDGNQPPDAPPAERRKRKQLPSPPPDVVGDRRPESCVTDGSEAWEPGKRGGTPMQPVDDPGSGDEEVGSKMHVFFAKLLEKHEPLPATPPTLLPARMESPLPSIFGHRPLSLEDALSVWRYWKARPAHCRSARQVKASESVWNVTCHARRSSSPVERYTTPSFCRNFLGSFGLMCAMHSRNI